MAFRSRCLKRKKKTQKKTVNNKGSHLFVLEWGIAVVIHYVKRIVIVEPNNVFNRRSMILVECNLDSVVECLAVFWVLVIGCDCQYQKNCLEDWRNETDDRNWWSSLGPLKLNWTPYSMLHGQQAQPQKLQRDMFLKLPSWSAIWNKKDNEKAIYGLHYNDECIYDLKKKSKRQNQYWL